MDTGDWPIPDNKPKRGPAASDRQLSYLQLRLLEWLLLQERTLDAQNSRELNRVGIRWGAKRFFVAYSRQAPTASQRASVSRSLHRLAERGLVVLSMQGKRTAHIKLTPQGRTLANAWSVRGFSERQIYDLEKNSKKYAALAILREEKWQERERLSDLSIDQVHAIYDKYRQRMWPDDLTEATLYEALCSEYMNIMEQIKRLVNLLGTSYLEDEIPTVQYLSKLQEESNRSLGRD